MKSTKTLLSFLIGAGLALSSCTKEDTPPVTSEPDTTPATYQFERDGSSTVSYSGQEERIAMLTTIGSELAAVNTGGTVSATALKDMFANENGAFASEGYTKDLKSKCANSADQLFFEGMMDEVALTSEQGLTASNGTAGLVLKEASTSGYLVNANGLEYRQVILKGLMGSVFYYRAIEDYLGVEIDSDDNETIVEGKNYTTMEHHYDEAFGYIGIPTDLSNQDTDPKDASRLQFWGEYTVKLHLLSNDFAMPGVNEELINAFIKGRHAIVNKDYGTRDEAIQTICNLMERICANNALNYLEDAKDDADIAVRLHHLGEAIGFMISMKAHIDGAASEAKFPRISSQAEIDNALAIVGLNTNLWELTNAEIDSAITIMTNAFGN